MKVSIVGGGIGGLTAALSLQKKGINVNLFEASDTLRAAGSGIWMSSNAVKVMEYLGFAPAFQKTGIEMKTVSVEDENGRILSKISMDAVKKKHRYAIHSVKRQSLHNLLSSQIDSSRIHTGKKLTGLSQNDETVNLSFSDGSSDQCSILIGADGIRSAVRESVYPGVPLRYSGQSCWYGLSETKLPENRRQQTTEIWMGKLRFGFTEVDNGQVYFFAVETSPAENHFHGDRTSHLLGLFQNAPKIVREILSGAKSENIIKNDLNDLKPFIPLVHGRVVLIGDAGHATTPNLGQGAAQAMEDGVLLAELLSKKDPQTALNHFETMRKKRIMHIVNTSWRMGQIAHEENPLMKNIFRGIFRMTPDFINIKMMDRVLTPVFP
ncbi:MAG: FAD-dependent monooxygenase [Spirochaetia bacterium]|nr:FAD-dependent monooxygenase [Spirochaetia bacterium]